MADPGAVLVELREEVAQLRNLFQRRLMDDKAKQRLFDELYSQVELGRKGLAAQSLEPLIREELLLLDRLERYRGADPDFVDTVRTELLEVLARRGVDEVEVTASFDPRVHEAVASQPASGDQVGSVVGIRRRGYVLGGRLVRPAQVVLGALDDPDASGEGIAPASAELASPAHADALDGRGVDGHVGFGPEDTGSEGFGSAGSGPDADDGDPV